ncbi:MAG: hypothetical protein ACXADX_07975 [Candidatus Hodarchaeales archaeon]|jgi:DNA-binding transcriptional ArsR family regulator
MSEDEIEYHLRGNTLLTYWYLLTISQATTIRQLQRALNFSSPSVSSHHLNRLVDLGLCEKQPDGTYTLTKMVHVGVLKHFIAWRGHLLPRSAAFAVFFSATFTLYALMFLFIEPGPFDRLVSLIALAIGATIGWAETYRIYKLRVL